ncbi:hypothetical protein DPEC_G00103820 [Dallia pectoralis]|uniref:Uncharacterized protein n=1 Tax=Dallia pectoralis TaxID=75939 RepID=A0ACC2GXF8_DALPE|nr:hypothetical protein DPEC_G00103820 [Dallia pectoralis]
MALGFLLGVFVLLSVWLKVRCADVPMASVETECRDRYLLVTTDIVAGHEPRFEAVDADGVYPITELYGAECGYMFSVLPVPGHAELRASYFSCHTDNQGDDAFSFIFNLIAADEDGEEVTYRLNETCYLPLPWSPREISCEENYMEVSVRNDMSCPFGKTEDDWTAASFTAHHDATSAWQVMFRKEGEEQFTSMSLTEARVLGYVFHLTQGRLVFRSPYSQPHSSHVTVNGTRVEVVHPILFSRQRWVVMMVDLVVACSTNEAMFDGLGLIWETPTLLSSLASSLVGLDSMQISMGVDGQLLDRPTATGRGYSLEINDVTTRLSIPFNAEGGYRHTFVMNNTYHQVYVLHLYFEQLLVDEGGVETRIRLHRPMSTPPLWQAPSVINQTVLAERIFTVYLGNITDDVYLVAVKLNGHEYTTQEANANNFNITMVQQQNSTLHGYTLRVPFDDAVVHKMYSTEGYFLYMLYINFTLAIQPQEEPFYHLMSVVAHFRDVFAPVFNAVCNTRNISFTMDHHPFDYLWEVAIGPKLLTPNLAFKHGYNMQNDSKSLTLDVPLFTVGYTYEDIHLAQFIGTFEILTRSSKTLEVARSLAKRCVFQTTELIVCSTKGVMTVVKDVTTVIQGAEPSRTSLKDSTCRPKETDDTRVLFNFSLDTCGTRVMVNYPHVVYENDIIIGQPSDSEAPVKTRPLVVTVRCEYPLSGLHKLFAYRRFEADAPGIGTMVVTEVSEKSPLTVTRPTISTTTATTTALRTTRRPLSFGKIDRYINNPQGRPTPWEKPHAIQPRTKYVRRFSWQMNNPKEQTTY